MEIAVLALFASVVGQWLKRFVWDKFGAPGVQVVVFIAALVGASVWYYAQLDESFMYALQQAGVIFASAIAFYEVLLKHLGFGSGREVSYE